MGQIVLRNVLFSVGSASFLLLSSCGPSQISGMPSQNPLYTQSQLVGLENSDRINRFQRLADIEGIPPPTIDQLIAPAGTAPTVDGPVPVVRVAFREDVFFASGSDVPLPQSAPIFDIIAKNMANDVPDAALTILGHTDSVGSDSYNMDLSKRRALAVMQELADRGVDPAQMSTIAIGYHQPIAPNNTLEGRALNRRVEFLISANPDANLSVVQQRNINPAYLVTSDGTESLPRECSVEVLRASPIETQVKPATPAVLTPAPAAAENLSAAPLTPVSVSPAPVAAVASPAPTAAPPKLKLSDVGPLQLRASTQLEEAPLQPPPYLEPRQLESLAPPANAIATGSNTTPNNN